jgi:hypothetical protein
LTKNFGVTTVRPKIIIQDWIGDTDRRSPTRLKIPNNFSKIINYQILDRLRESLNLRATIAALEAKNACLIRV